MRTIFKAMCKKNSGISEDILLIFEKIIQKYEVPGKGLGPDCDKEFIDAMEKHLTKEQRWRLYETNGGCMGTGHDKERQIFALKYAHLDLNEKMALFAETFGRHKPVLNDNNTISVAFACSHRYGKVKRDKIKNSAPPPIVESYFERCAGGRLYELQKALGINLKLKSVDISSLEENFDNPVVYTFEIVE